MVTSNLKTILDEKGIRISDLSEETGISRTTLEGIYYDRCIAISFEVLDKLCVALDCSIEDIITRNGKNIKVFNVEKLYSEALEGFSEFSKKYSEIIIKKEQFEDRISLLSNLTYGNKSYFYYRNQEELNYSESEGKLTSFYQKDYIEVPRDKSELVKAIITKFNILGVPKDYTWSNIETLEDFLKYGEDINLDVLNIVNEDGTIEYVDTYDLSNIEGLKRIYDRAFYENEIQPCDENFFKNLFR